MKRTLLIVGGITIVLILIGIWAYILFTGTTSENVSFNDFGFGDTTDPTVIVTPDTNPAIDTEPESTTPDRLQQLTTGPVAGYVQLTTSAANPTVMYVESGTGHIYTINLTTKESNRASATTIPLTNSAAITPNGRHVMMQSNHGQQASFIIGTIGSTSDRLSNFELNEPVVSFTATIENEFLFATQGVGELVVKKYNPLTSNSVILFTIPFVETTIAWNHTAAGPHIVYPKTTNKLEGYVYSYTNGVADRVNASGFGLSAVGSSQSTIYSKLDGETYQTYNLSNKELSSVSTPLTFIPEKCQFTKSSGVIALCGAGLESASVNMPDSWYRGTYTANDAIWEYNTTQQSARLLVSPETTTGRMIDLVNPKLSINDHNLYFQNKLDQTLWVYNYIITQ